MGDKWGRRRTRLEEKHRWYFEEAARRVIATGHATIDLGVTTLDVRLRRKGLLRSRWLTIELDSQPLDQSRMDGSGEDLVRPIVFYLINVAAGVSGVQIPTRKG